MALPCTFNSPGRDEAKQTDLVQSPLTKQGRDLYLFQNIPRLRPRQCFSHLNPRINSYKTL
jgi:hypothetical protein